MIRDWDLVLPEPVRNWATIRWCRLFGHRWNPQKLYATAGWDCRQCLRCFDYEVRDPNDPESVWGPETRIPDLPPLRHLHSSDRGVRVWVDCKRPKRIRKNAVIPAGTHCIDRFGIERFVTNEPETVAVLKERLRVPEDARAK